MHTYSGMSRDDIEAQDTLNIIFFPAGYLWEWERETNENLRHTYYTVVTINSIQFEKNSDCDTYYKIASAFNLGFNFNLFFRRQ